MSSLEGYSYGLMKGIYQHLPDRLKKTMKNLSVTDDLAEIESRHLLVYGYIDHCHYTNAFIGHCGRKTSELYCARKTSLV
jgi:hypothetical protein